MRSISTALLLLLTACLPAWADPGRLVCQPAARTAPASYAAPRTYVAPHGYADRPATDYRRPLFVADAVFYVFDPRVRDVFYFLGPPPALQPGLALGVTADGQEVRGLAAQAAPAAAPAEEAAQPAEATAPAAIRAVLGYESEASPAPRAVSPAQSALDQKVEASLKASCFACHQAGNKPKGQFTLFDARGRLVKAPDWELIRKVTTPDVRTRAPARMPPTGKPALPAFVKLEINRRGG